MTKHELKTCPHCLQHFECKSGDIINCQCETVCLNAEQRQHIAQLYTDCLCATCLAEIRHNYNIQQHQQHLLSIIHYH